MVLRRRARKGGAVSGTQALVLGRVMRGGVRKGANEHNFSTDYQEQMNMITKNILYVFAFYAF